MSLNPKILRKLMREVADLQKSPPDDIRICVPDEDGFANLTALIRGPEGTPFAKGFFRVKFVFTSEFPQKPPAVYITTKIFHPNVSPSNGAVCVSTLSKDWVSTHTLTHVLVTIRCLLVAPNPDSALDEEAGRMIQEDYESYERRAKLITSVHATPRAIPKEFEEVASTAGTSSLSKPEASPSSVTSSSVAPSASPAIPIPAATTNTTTITAPAVTSRKPLSSSSATTGLTPHPSGKTTSSSPANSIHTNSNTLLNVTTPLGTADSNVVQPIKTKRAASATGLVGGEKRKKALKRL